MLKSLRRNVFADPAYRRYLVVLTVTGAAGAAGMPLIPLFLVQELHATLAQVGVLTVAGLFGVALNLPVGRLSDRLRSRRPLMCALAGSMALGWAVVGFTTSLWAALAVYVVLLSAPYGTLNAQIFAGLSDTMAARGEEKQSTVNTTLRGGYSFGYMLGPLASTAIAAAAGLRTAFWVAVGAYVLVLLLALRLPDAARSGGKAKSAEERAGFRAALPLVFVACGLCLVIVGDMLRAVYLPIYVVERLHQSTLVFGVLVAVVAGLEVAVFPVMGMLADRFGIKRVIAASLAVGVAAYAVLASSGAMWQVWVFHVIQIVLFAATIGLGLSYAQSLVPGRPGLASSTFFSAQTAAKPLSGVVGVTAVGALGLPGIFWVPAGLCALCLVAFTLAALRERRNAPERDLALDAGR